MHRILHVGKNIGNFIYYNVPLMMIIALMLALVDKPMMTWTRMNMLLMLMECDQQPSGERDKSNKSIAKVGEQNSAISCRGPTKLVTARV